jgi:Zn-dependent protease with chaperone function
MPLLLLLCLSLACLPEWRQPFEGARPIHSLAGTLVVIGIMTLAARHLARKTCWKLRTEPGERARWLRYYGQRRTWYALAQMAAFVFILFSPGCGWGWAVQQVLKDWRGDLPMPAGAELLILAPLPLMLVSSWLFFYDVERALLEGDSGQAPFGGRLGYVGFQLRQNLALVAAPVLVLIFAQGLFRQFPTLFPDDEARVLLIAPVALAVVVLMPWLMRLVLKLKPMPEGELRDRLEAAARRLRCRYTDILVWNTRLGVANAMVVGLTPWLRYILLTDRLLQEMAPEEIEAVFGHEVGHIRHRHIALYLVFLLASVVVLSQAYGVIESVIGSVWPSGYARWQMQDSDLRTTWMALPSLGFLAAYIFGVFGFLSRRCERQADVFGCRAVSCDRPDCQGHDHTTVLAPGGQGLCPVGIRTFCRALDKVAVLNGISRSRPGWLHSWQHSTIGKRIEFLQRLNEDPALEGRFQRRVFWTKAALMLATALALIMLSLCT